MEIDATTLLGFENLSEILLFHVLDGAYYSPVVFDASPIALASLQGTNLNFAIVEGMIEVNGAQVIIEDILTTNGLIHVIDTVLLYE